MRVLSVRQPWAWAIIHAGKDVENRSRSLGPYRGPVAIHASKGDPKQADVARVCEILGVDLAELARRMTATGVQVNARGSVVGVVDLTGSHPGSTVTIANGMGAARRQVPCCSSPWAERDSWHLTLANPRPTSDPLACQGRLGLWRPPPALTAAILAGTP